MDVAEEQSNTLSRCGSFYYSTLVDASKDDAEFVSHLTWQSKFPAQLQNIIEAVMGRSHFQDFYRLIKFTDADVNWRGMKAALQYRTSVPPSNPQIPDYNNRLPDYIVGEGTALESDKGLLADSEEQVIIAPKADSWITLPGDTQLFWDLRIDPSLYVTSIRTPEGKLWFAGQEYTAQYGKLTFTENPIKLFPDMELMADSCIVRKPHIYNHMLRLGSVYETPDRVLHYYRQAQTPKTFYLAAAQACGMAVIRNECKIINRMPMFDGYSYSTTDGIYEAPYKHNSLEPGTTLPEGYVIGGNDLFLICGPGEALPTSVKSIALGTAVPVPGLKATNAAIVIWNEKGQYRPAYSGDPDAVEAWYKYLNAINDDDQTEDGTASTDTMGSPVYENAITHFRNTACANRCLVACTNDAYMSTEMKLRCMEFLRRELPTGSVLVTANMPVAINGVPVNPESITVVSTGVPTSTTFDRSSYHAVALRVSDSAGFIAWNPELTAGAATKLRSITIRCASNTSNPEGTTATVRVAVYQADEGRFMGVSNVAHTWTQNAKKKFTFAEDLPIKLTDRLLFVYVTPEATIEELINPMMTGLDVGADNLTLSAWRTELRKATYPAGWGVITSASLSSPNNGYIFDLELELAQQV